MANRSFCSTARFTIIVASCALGIACADVPCGKAEVMVLLQVDLSIDGGGDDSHPENEGETLQPLQLAGSQRRLLSERSGVLYAKFHKVAGTTVANAINEMTHESRACSKVCDGSAPMHERVEDAHCANQPHTCTGHMSMRIVNKTWAVQEIPVNNPTDLTNPSNLLPAAVRKSMLEQQPQNLHWLHPEESSDFGSFAVFRDPIEKLRSLYYFRCSHNASGGGGGLGPHCLSHEGFVSFLNDTRDEVNAYREADDFSGISEEATMRCCEYIATLGAFSVKQAKLVAATMFDHIGLTEKLDQTLVTIARMFGEPYETLLVEPEKTGGEKLDWTAEELELAREIVKEDQEIYEFVVGLAQVRLMSLWGSQEELDSAVLEYQAIVKDADDLKKVPGRG